MMLTSSIQEHVLTRLGSHAEEVVDKLKVDFDLDASQWRDVIHTTVTSLLDDVFNVPWAQGKPMDEVVRKRLFTVLEKEGYDIKGKGVSLNKDKYMNATEQNKRCDELVDAQLVAMESREVQESLLKLMQDMMSSGFPADMFNLEGHEDGEINIDFRAMNDLVINFCFWALENDKSMTKNHRLVFYLYMFRGFDAKAVYGKVLEFEQNDNHPKQKKRRKRTENINYDLVSHDPDTEKAREESVANIETCHREVLAFFEEGAPGLLEEFLRRSNFKSTRDCNIIRDYPGYIGRKNVELEEIKKAGGYYTAISTRKAIKDSLSFPENEMEVCLEEGLIVQAQRGNTTARNTLLMSIYRLVGSVAFGPGAKSHIGAKKLEAGEHHYDIEQDLVAMILEKIVATDPRFSRFSNYMRNWCERMVGRYVGELELVRKPPNVHLMMNTIFKNPDLPDEVIAKNWSVSLKAVQNARRQLTQRRYVELDAPKYSSDGLSTNAEQLLEASDESFLPKLNNRLAGEGLRRCLEQLPPRDKYIIAEHVIEGRSLKSVGEDLRGLSGERIRQLRESIFDNLRGLSEDGVPLSHKRKKSGNINVMIDEKAFEEWCDNNCANITEKITGVSPYFLMRAKLGLEIEVFGNARFGVRPLEKYFEDNESISCTTGIDTLYRCLKSLEKDLIAEQGMLPPEERFLLVTDIAEVYGAAREYIKGLEIGC